MPGLSNSIDRFNGLVASLAIKAPCVAVAIANITLSGEQTVNGVAVVSGDRVLVIAQTSSVDNGIYDVSSGAWARSADFDGNRDVVSGTFVTVATATVGRNPYYQVTTANPITIGTTAINFTLADGPNVSWPLTPAEDVAGLTDNDIDDSYEPGNLVRYGAVGNGSADDTVPTQNAVDVAKNSGSRVFVPLGKYLLTSSVTGDETYKNILIEGDTAVGFQPGEVGSQFVASSGIVMFQFGSASATNHAGPEFRNIAFDDTSGTVLGAALLLRSNHVRFTNCRFTGFTVGYGAKFDGTGDACVLPIFFGCNFRYNKFGITTTGLVTGLRVIGGYFTQSASTPIADAIAIDYTGDTLFAQTSVDSHATAIKLTGPSTAAENIVMGCRFEQNTLSVHINNSGRCMVTANTMIGDEVGDVGVQIDGANAVDPVITNNPNFGLAGGYVVDNRSGGPSSIVIDPSDTNIQYIRSLAGDLVHLISNARQSFGDDTYYRAQTNRGGMQAVLGTDFQATATVIVGSESSHDVAFVRNGSAIAWLTATGLRMVSATGPVWAAGSGTPEGSVTAPIGSFYSRTDGGAVTSFYVKESGSGNTGWVAK